MTETELLEILARGEDSRWWGDSRRPMTGEVAGEVAGEVMSQLGSLKRAGAADG